jgi:UDP-3-O-[3-hydroxymyristoyl] glucosamine N-acyltransferase
MEFSLSEIAKIVGGEIAGDSSRIIRGTAGFEASREDDITYAGNATYLKQVEHSKAGAVLVPGDFECPGKNLVRVENPRIAFSTLCLRFAPPKTPIAGHESRIHTGIHFTCGAGGSIGPFVTIGDDVTLGERVVLHANVFIGNQVQIGDDVEIFPNVTILNGCKIGSRVIINAGSVIGGDGFGFEPNGEQYVKINHFGIVQIDEDVEIGACNTIDRGTTGRTWIQKGVKTDNLVHIGHNVVVGENTLLVSQVGISGSVTIGKHVVLAGKVGVAGHLTIGDNVVAGAKAGIAKSIPDGETVSGYPTMPHALWLRVVNIIPTLPELKKKINRLEKIVNSLVQPGSSNKNDSSSDHH